MVIRSLRTIPPQPATAATAPAGCCGYSRAENSWRLMPSAVEFKICRLRGWDSKGVPNIWSIWKYVKSLNRKGFLVAILKTIFVEFRRANRNALTCTCMFWHLSALKESKILLKVMLAQSRSLEKFKKINRLRSYSWILQFARKARKTENRQQMTSARLLSLPPFFQPPSPFHSPGSYHPSFVAVLFHFDSFGTLWLRALRAVYRICLLSIRLQACFFLTPCSSCCVLVCIVSASSPLDCKRASSCHVFQQE